MAKASRTTGKAVSDTASTRERLIEGAIATLRDHGIAGTSVRTIAAAAGVNQALVFYHFASLNDLISQACKESTAVRVERYREQFANVSSLTELLAVGRRIHEVERGVGNVTVLAQVLAGAQQNEDLAAAARRALELWIAELDVVVSRILDDSVLAGIVEPGSLTEALAASFIGMELYDGIDSASSGRLFAALEPLAAMADMVDDLGAVPRKAIRAGLRRATATGRTKNSSRKK